MLPCFGIRPGFAIQLVSPSAACRCYSLQDPSTAFLELSGVPGTAYTGWVLDVARRLTSFALSIFDF